MSADTLVSAEDTGELVTAEDDELVIGAEASDCNAAGRCWIICTKSRDSSLSSLLFSASMGRARRGIDTASDAKVPWLTE